MKHSAGTSLIFQKGSLVKTKDILGEVNTDADGTSSEGIVLPSANFDGMTLHLELSDGSSFFNWDLNNSKADKFEAG